MEDFRMDDKLQLIDELKGFSETNSIPEGAGKRKQTNRVWLIIFGIVLSVLMALIGYTSQQSDMNRMSHGYDRCGNVCGSKNSPVAGIKCSGKDMRDKPYLLLEEVDDYPKVETVKCVESCPPNYFLLVNTCLNNMEYKYTTLMTSCQAVLNGLYMAADKICYMFLVSIAVTVALVLLLRYATKVVVWGGVIGIMFIVVSFGILLTVFVVRRNKNGGNIHVVQYNIMTYGIVFSVLTILTIIMAFVLRKRIKLVIMVIEEAMKAIFDMPLLFLQPVLTFSVIVIAVVSYIYVNLFLLTSGKLLKMFKVFKHEPEYEYRIQAIGIFTMVFNTCFTVWMIEFILACQHMIVAGTISAWYFCRDRSALVSPIYNSVYNLIRYHLGTVAIGSLIITLVTLLRSMLKGLARRWRFLVDCICGPIEAILRYLTKNALIQTAMHGGPFWSSGKKAVRILLANIVDVSALNCVTYFVLFTIWGLIAVSAAMTGLFLYDDQNEYYFWAVYCAVILAGVLGRVILCTIEIAIDTLFMCYCEDSIINDGVTTPFFMSRNLMLFMDQSKDAFPNRK